MRHSASERRPLYEQCAAHAVTNARLGGRAAPCWRLAAGQLLLQMLQTAVLIRQSLDLSETSSCSAALLTLQPLINQSAVISAQLKQSRAQHEVPVRLGQSSAATEATTSTAVALSRTAQLVLLAWCNHPQAGCKQLVYAGMRAR